MCNLCGGQTEPFLVKDSFSLFLCSHCGVAFVNPMPTLEFLREKVYTPEVYQQGKRRKLSVVPANKKTKVILSKLKILTGGRKLLDAGCSNGQFMYHAAGRGFETKGVELNAGTAQIAKENGLDVFVGTLEEANLPSSSYDVVTLNDLIEHVAEPQSLLAECHRLLAPGGILVIGTPNLDCLFNNLTWALYKCFRIPWSAVTPPHHLYQFSSRSLRMLLENNNFASKDISFVPTSSLRYELGVTKTRRDFRQKPNIRNAVRFLFTYFCYTIFYILSKVWTWFGGENNGLIGFYRKI
jgi:2-polyprenyl-3-methyl-5-hydroxy-6-metoxy-1,4-benzoquinol methylase